MAAKKPTEKWKDVSFDFKFTNDYRLQVSSLGNLRAYNKFSGGELLPGSMVNGYRIIRLKLYSPKDKKVQEGLTAKHMAMVNLRDRLRKWALEDATKNKKRIAEGTVKLNAMQGALRKARQQDIKGRTNYYHALVHRLVAEYFVTPGSPRHSIVGHLDFNKMNNAAGNLKWMTPEENYTHQQLSPHVIREKKERVTTYRDTPRNAKLTAVQVGALKKSLVKGKSLESLVKKYKITRTQILVIKRGKSWRHVKAAE